MPRRKKNGTLLLVQGLDVSNPAEYIGEQASPNNGNFMLRSGLLGKRNGTTALGTTQGEEIMRGTQFTRASTTYNVRIGLDEIWHYTSGAWADITGVDLTGTTDDIVDIAIPLLSGVRILCFTNGIDAIRKWTGTGDTAALGGTPPKAKFIQEYKTYLVCANITGGTDIDQRVQWSNTADPETWDSGNAGTLDLIEDAEAITGLSLFGDYLAVHKKSSINLGYLIQTSDIFKFDRKNTGAGTIANSTIVNLPTGIQVFLAVDGIRAFNGITSQLIDTKVNDEIRGGINTSYSHKSWAVLVNEFDEVWFGVPIGSQTTPDTIYKYNYNTGVMYKDTRSLITAAWRSSASSASKTWDATGGTWDSSTERWNATSTGAAFSRIHLANNEGLVTQVDTSVNNDNGVAIDAFWESKDFEPEEKGRIARWQRMEFWAKGNTVRVWYSTDSGYTWTEMVDSPFTLDSAFPEDSAPLIAYFDAVSSKLRVKFSNNVAGETVDIKQFVLGYVDREMR